MRQLVLIKLLQRLTDLRTIDETFPTLRTLVRHPLGNMGNGVQRVGCVHRAGLM